MAGPKTLKEEIESYFGGVEVKTKREPAWHQANHDTLAWEMVLDKSTLSRKLNRKNNQYVTSNEVRDIGSILIHWKRIMRRSQLLRLFELGGYPSLEVDWQEEPWKSLIDDTQPPDDSAELLPLDNPSFDEWKDKIPVKWLCNKKTGDIKQVQGRENGSALEISGNRDNQYWVYCRTRETQVIPVVPGSKIRLSFWARKTQEGRNPDRQKNVEVAYYVADDWQWEFSRELTDMDDTWRQYSVEWWNVPDYVSKIAVGVVVYKDGAFQVDNIAVHMRVDK